MIANTRAAVWLCLCLAAGGAPAASEDEAALLDTLRALYPGTGFSAVSRTPIADLYEVWMGSNVAYVARSSPRFLLFGHLFDAQESRDLTAGHAPPGARVERASEAPIVFDALPLADAIKTVHGAGTRKLAVFSDPQCPYCRALEPELAQLSDVTIYTFLVPFKGVEVPLAVWCADDRPAMWARAMRGEAIVASDVSCDHPLDRNAELAQRLQVFGTPTLLFADGRRLEGAADAAVIEARLTQARAADLSSSR